MAEINNSISDIVTPIISSSDEVMNNINDTTINPNNNTNNDTNNEANHNNANNNNNNNNNEDLEDSEDTLISSRKRQKNTLLQLNEEEMMIIPINKSISSSSSSVSSSGPIDPLILSQYYSRLFPCDLLLHWLKPANNLDPITALKNREFSFTLESDVYVRYCSFSNTEQFKSSLIERKPFKIDIGAIYNTNPVNHNSVANFTPLQKELVFDIDMTDYDDIRLCCSSAEICNNCWILMKAAVKVLNAILTQDFGFQHILYVYSGRRGIHCWVCDERAKILSNELRTSIVEYISVYLGKETIKNKMSHILYPLHPCLSGSYELLKPYWLNLLNVQHYLEIESEYNKILEFFDIQVRDEFTKIFIESHTDGETRWKKLESQVDKFLKNSKAKNIPQSIINSIRTVLPRIVFSYCYPRLDVNVSKQLNHLLKSPFCVHPKTGRVCVPIDPDNMDNFLPSEVPTLNQLYEELNRNTDEFTNKKPTWKDTSLKADLLYFQQFVAKLLDNSKLSQFAKLQQQQQELVTDW